MNQEKKFEFQVKLTAKELWLFSLYHSNRGMIGIFNIIFSAAAIFLLCFTWSTVSASYRVLLIICAMMFTVWQPGLLYLKAAKQAKTPAVKDPMGLSFSDSGIVVTQSDQTMELEWDHIGRVDGVPNMLIFYMDRIHAYLIPKDVLGEQEEGFRALLREKLPPERRKRI